MNRNRHIHPVIAEILNAATPHVPPPPAAPGSAWLQRARLLLTDLSNKQFLCGEHDRHTADEDYSVVSTRAQAAQAVLLEHLEDLDLLFRLVDAMNMADGLAMAVMAMEAVDDPVFTPDERVRLLRLLAPKENAMEASDGAAH